MNLISEEHACEYFADKSVALVGNGPSIMDRAFGDEIDSHDAVVRMNAGIPEMYPHFHNCIGTRTSVLTLGLRRFYKDAKRKDVKPDAYWWLKPEGLTPLGDREWQKMVESPEEDFLFRYPRAWEDEITEQIGAPPSSGLRMAEALVRRAGASRVTAFGIDLFAGIGDSWWKPGQALTAPHDGAREHRLWLSLGFREEGVGRWLWSSP